MAGVKPILFISFTILSGCLAAPIFAQEPIGAVSSIEGIADISRCGADAVLLKENDRIGLKDRIRTKAYSKVSITFLDNSVVKLAPSTCISIEEYMLDHQLRRQSAMIYLSRGKLEAIVAKTSRPDTFVVTTPNAKGVVKGSEIFMVYQAGQTSAYVKDGLMAMSGQLDPGKKINIGRGNAILVLIDETMGSSRSYMDSEMKRLLKEVEPALKRETAEFRGEAKLTATIALISGGGARLYKKGAPEWRSAGTNDLIEETDRLQTTEDGTAQVRLSNGNIIVLQPNSELVIVKLRTDPSTGNYENEFKSTQGKIKAIVERLGPESKFEVKTPTAVCGARGTIMYLNITPSQTQAFYEGGGGIITSTVTGQTQLLEAGQNSAIDISGAISAPAYTPMEQKNVMDQSYGQGAAAGYLKADTAAVSTPTIEGTGVASGVTAAYGPGSGEPALNNAASKPFAALPFSEAASTVPVTTTPQVLCSVDLTRAAGSNFFNSANTEVTIYDNHTWKASEAITGVTQVTIGSDWALTLEGIDSNDKLVLGGSGSGSTWTNGQWTAPVDPTSMINVPGTGKAQLSAAGDPSNAGGTYTGSAPNQSFTGTAQGNWRWM